MNIFAERESFKPWKESLTKMKLSQVECQKIFWGTEYLLNLKFEEWETFYFLKIFRNPPPSKKQILLILGSNYRKFPQKSFLKWIFAKCLKKCFDSLLFWETKKCTTSRFVNSISCITCIIWLVFLAVYPGIVGDSDRSAWPGTIFKSLTKSTKVPSRSPRCICPRNGFTQWNRGYFLQSHSFSLVTGPLI